MSSSPQGSELRELRALADAWTDEFPRRSAGGINALSGFSYQFLVVLYETVSAWLECERAERLRPQVFTEKLSDVVRRDGERVTVTQVKRRHARATVASALDELWTVREVAARATPGLLARLRFRILAATGDVDIAHATIAGWTPREGCAPSELSAFQSAVEVAQLHDPETELLALLANEFRPRDPLGYVHRWLGVLVGAAEQGDGFDGAARSIWSDLIDLGNLEERERAAPVYHWTATDCGPDAPSQGDILTGEQPRVRQLREGFFADRPRVLEPLLAKAESWLQAHQDTRDKAVRVPVFWIAGRSGSGKSVALLQLLAEIHAQVHAAAPILWLGNRVGLLPDAARMASAIGEEVHRAIVAIDDPYRPDSQEGVAPEWHELLAALDLARESDSPDAVPVLFCCGPTEQAERLRADLPDDLDVTTVLVGDPDAAELAHLRGWYRARTGHDAPETEDANLLLVQLFFEWRTGEPLRSFAVRFRNRIMAADPTGELFRFITTLLALNRLYVGYPGAAYEGLLPSSLRDILAQLQHEHHIEAGIRDDRDGVWLTHPHLANCIYEAWYPADANIHERRAHLRAGATICRDHGRTPAMQTAPIWSLARGVTDTVGDLRARIAGDLGELVADLYLDVNEAFGGELPTSHLPAWVKLQLDAGVGELRPDPVATAIARLATASTEDTGLRLTCHMLLTAREPNATPATIEAGRRAVEDLLSRSTQWREWPYVASDMLAREPTTIMSKLVPRWCREHLEHSMCPRLVRLLITKTDLDPDLRRAISSLIGDAPANVSWGDIAIYLMEHDGKVDPGIAHWLARHRDEEQVVFVLSHLIRNHPDPPAIEYARQ
jgi:hypothetical protein